VLQRIVGVAIDHTMSKGDPEHFSVEGSGVTIRGLTYVRSELNGRDVFSANGGRALNFEDVPPELMKAVNVYKAPSAEQIEGTVGGLVNLETFMPFDFKGLKVGLTVADTYSRLAAKSTPSASVMLSDSWDTSAGKFGALIDLAYSDSKTRTDAFQVEPYYPRDNLVADQSGTLWIPKGSQWRSLEFDRKREGIYAALQYRKGDFDSALTYFKSKYRMEWNENALFAQSNPYNIEVAPGATFDAGGIFKRGTISDGTDHGVNFNDDTRVANRDSGTQELAWKGSLKFNEKLSFTADAQYIRSNTKSFDSTVATGIVLPSETLDLTGRYPTLIFDDAQRAYLADPANYYWAFTMEHKDRSIANEKAVRLDGRWNFDSAVLQDLRFGMRFTNREALTENSNPGFNWAAITQPWQVGWDISGLAKLSDPRFSGNTHLHNFSNFFNGNASVPSLVFPDVSTAAGYPDSYAQLHTYHDILCAEQAAAQGWSSGCAQWQPATFGTDPSGTNNQRERTEAAYSQLRFGWDELAWPIDGNVGVRVVYTDAQARGYTLYNSTFTIPEGANVVGVPVPDIAPFAPKAGSFNNTYTNVLPSLNLRMKVGNDWQFRFAADQGISRPDFSQLQAYTTLTQNVTSHTVDNPDGSKTVVVTGVSDTGTGSGNPMLTPVKSNQVDLTAEWYFNKSGSMTFAAFDKELKDIIVNQTTVIQLPDTSGAMHDFVTTSPVNGAKGYARGFEVAYHQYFDRLPGWMSGFGIETNYTYVDSRRTLYQPVDQPYCVATNNGAANLNLNLNGCDTDGRTFGDLPLENLSRNTINFALLYDKGGFSARAAYNWRSRYLQAVNVNGTNGTDATNSDPNAPPGQTNIAWGLPTWQDAYGTLDAGMSYQFDNNVKIALEGTNLTDSTAKQRMQQHIGMMGRAWFSSGPTYTVRMSYSF
jgi:TonB-dependent receptor